MNANYMMRQEGTNSQGSSIERKTSPLRNKKNTQDYPTTKVGI